MGAYKQLEIPEIEETNENLVLFEDNTFQLFNVIPEKKLTPIRDILAEMKIAFDRNFNTVSNQTIS
jgi:hypothetical protein